MRGVTASKLLKRQLQGRQCAQTQPARCVARQRVYAVIEHLARLASVGRGEPLIMGQDNGNTTNTWLNLPKILELTLSGGVPTENANGLGACSTHITCHNRIKL